MKTWRQPPSEVRKKTIKLAGNQTLETSFFWKTWFSLWELKAGALHKVGKLKATDRDQNQSSVESNLNLKI